MGIIALLYLAAQSGMAATIIGAQDYAVDSDVVLESAVKEIKSAPRDAVDFAGDAVKFAADESVTAVNGVKAAFKSNPREQVRKDAAIRAADAWDSSNDIVFRSYKISEAVSEEIIGSSGAVGDVMDVSSVFTGVDFPKGASTYFRPEFNRLFVRNTLSNILMIEDYLAELHSAERGLMGKQVSIESKFVEVNQKTLDELGFEWTFVGKGNGPASVGDLNLPAGTDLFSQGLRTAARALSTTAGDTMNFNRLTGSLNWSMVVTALEQSENTDILSAPSVVTRDGDTANIMVGEERTVSVGYDMKYAESSLWIQHDFEIADMGVTLEVTPEIRSDRLIDLDLSPRVIDLIGYDEYRPIPANAVERNNAVGITEYIARLPYYRLREMQTQVTVADGSTVGMGGLIYDKRETFRDKVPVLGSIPFIGRLFRSEGENSVKRNLMIFVTATQVDINGRKAADLAMKTK
jgi:general secretion pathway protein D